MKSRVAQRKLRKERSAPVLIHHSDQFYGVVEVHGFLVQRVDGASYGFLKCGWAHAASEDYNRQCVLINFELIAVVQDTVPVRWPAGPARSCG
jgi:hypothetical protein